MHIAFVMRTLRWLVRYEQLEPVQELLQRHATVFDVTYANLLQSCASVDHLLNSTVSCIQLLFKIIALAISGSFKETQCNSVNRTHDSVMQLKSAADAIIQLCDELKSESTPPSNDEDHNRLSKMTLDMLRVVIVTLHDDARSMNKPGVAMTAFAYLDVAGQTAVCDMYGACKRLISNQMTYATGVIKAKSGGGGGDGDSEREQYK